MASGNSPYERFSNIVRGIRNLSNVRSQVSELRDTVRRAVAGRDARKPKRTSKRT